VADTRCNCGLEAQQLVESLADDFELTLNGGSEEQVCRVIRKGLALGELD
jgi:hypothetical protein